MRITKLCQRHEVSKWPWESGSHRLTRCRVVTNLQFVTMQQSKAW